jgi:hypothetical protein
MNTDASGLLEYDKVNVEKYKKWLWVIRTVHYMTVLFLIFAPFLPSELFLTYHAMFMPFLWIHWVTNNDICALSLAESKLTGVENHNHTFLGSLISPVFKIKNRDFYVASVVLFAVTLLRLHFQYNFGLAKETYRQIVMLLQAFF